MNTIYPTETYSVTIQGCYEPFLAENVESDSDYDSEYDTDTDTLSSDEFSDDSDLYDEFDKHDVNISEPVYRSIELDIKQVQCYVYELEEMKKNSVISSIIDIAYKQIDFAERICKGDITDEEHEKYPIHAYDFVNYTHYNALIDFEQYFNKYTKDLVEFVIKMRD